MTPTYTVITKIRRYEIRALVQRSRAPFEWLTESWNPVPAAVTMLTCTVVTIVWRRMVSEI
jgi:hypothetical protein